MKYIDIVKTESAISLVKENFSSELAKQLNLLKISSPVAVLDGTGINDDLNGVERPVAFQVKNMNGKPAVVVQSLAKWKRIKLAEIEAQPGEGILTDMRAIRPDEDYSPLHSIFVDQWDWELCIDASQRNLSFLKSIVEKIYFALWKTEQSVYLHYNTNMPVLPEKITFIHAEQLLQMYPDLPVKERENIIAEKNGAVFIIGVGCKLSNGEFHDGRAPDYDDWSSPNDDGYFGLNGDIIVWHPVLKSAFEISSMGIRVNKEVLIKQLHERGCSDRADLFFHQQLLDGKLPQCIGGGIGQSRVCMFMLKKRHIGEVQVSIWPEEERKKLSMQGIELL